MGKGEIPRASLDVANEAHPSALPYPQRIAGGFLFVRRLLYGQIEVGITIKSPQHQRWGLRVTKSPPFSITIVCNWAWSIFPLCLWNGLNKRIQHFFDNAIFAILVPTTGRFVWLHTTNKWRTFWQIFCYQVEPF